MRSVTSLPGSGARLGKAITLDALIACATAPVDPYSCQQSLHRATRGTILAATVATISANGATTRASVRAIPGDVSSASLDIKPAIRALNALIPAGQPVRTRAACPHAGGAPGWNSKWPTAWTSPEVERSHSPPSACSSLRPTAHLRTGPMIRQVRDDHAHDEPDELGCVPDFAEAILPPSYPRRPV